MVHDAAPITLTTADGRIWEQVPGPAHASIPGVLRLDFRSGHRKATLFKPATSCVARLGTPSGKRLVIVSITLPGAAVTPSGNVEVAA
ncbi:hypothetical protein L1280_002816 [Deinococcus sp. HSC-46F16]|uniref:hypothetical protein n=1 Tax=Deinococcus sp. HSC-46F16 TaxID=2910968 RepID=UPI00209D02E4|nr:hypothetical protein [Deinococcus sp. HSC-46F16]MCP2015648.1 hypothetical protein [Deinococcus sp. HSC-46F16]